MNSKSIMSAVCWILIPLIFGVYLIQAETKTSFFPDDTSTASISNSTPSSQKGKAVEIEKQVIKIKYYDSCGVGAETVCKLDIAVNSSIESNFTLQDNMENKIDDGQFQVGKNKISIPYGPGFVKKGRHVYTLKLSKADYSDEVTIALNLSYEYPRNFVFNYETGVITLKNKARLQKQINKHSYYDFDKKKLLKSGVTNVLLGVAVLLAKSGMKNVKERVDQQSIRTSIDSSGRIVSTFGIGITVYGLSSIFRAFKRRELKGDKIDKKMRKEIEALKEKVVVSIRPTIQYREKEVD